MPVVFGAKHHKLHVTIWPEAIFCMKHMYLKCLVHLLLWEIDGNVPTADIMKWNILDAICSVGVSWESIVPVFI